MAPNILHNILLTVNCSDTISVLYYNGSHWQPDKVSVYILYFP